MVTKATTITRTRWTAHELRKLPAHKRDQILEAAALSAEAEYRRNRELTGFEAFGKDDIHGESGDSEVIAICVSAP